MESKDARLRDSRLGQSYIVALDQGTTSSRVLLINQDLKVIDIAQRPLTQISSQPGWTEHDPEEIFNTVIECLKEVVERQKLTAENVKAVGITNQRETTIAFDRATGKALHNGIVWHDKRTADVVARITDKNGGNADVYREVCGLPINTYFSAGKMRWLLENSEEVKTAATAGTLRLSTVDTWLIHKLTNGKTFVTDSSNASRTMLMDLNTLEWSDHMIKEFDISKDFLPTIIKSSSDDFGSMDIDFLRGVPITGVLGDQHASALGHVLRQGEVKNTYGTGCFILSNVGPKPIQSKFGLLSTMCYRIGEETNYALEGAVEIAGAAVEWAKTIGIVSDVKELESLAQGVPDCGDVYFVPAFSGIFSPYWRDDARGLIIGINGHTSKGHLSRALLEAPCLRTTEVVESMEKDSGKKMEVMSVDGGMTVNNFLMQTQADFSNCKILRKVEKEITAVGAAIAAGLKVGVWSSLDDARSKIAIEKEFVPAISEDLRVKKNARWKEAVSRSLGFGWA